MKYENEQHLEPATHVVLAYLIRQFNSVPSIKQISRSMFLSKMIVVMADVREDLAEFFRNPENFHNCVLFMEQVHARSIVEKSGRADPHSLNLPSFVHHWLTNVVHTIHKGE